MSFLGTIVRTRTDLWILEDFAPRGGVLDWFRPATIAMTPRLVTTSVTSRAYEVEDLIDWNAHLSSVLAVSGRNNVIQPRSLVIQCIAPRV